MPVPAKVQIDTHYRAPPRTWSPPGVVLRRMNEGETVLRPVLMCEACAAPTLHLRWSPGICHCMTCGKARRW